MSSNSMSDEAMNSSYEIMNSGVMTSLTPTDDIFDLSDYVVNLSNDINTCRRC